MSAPFSNVDNNANNGHQQPNFPRSDNFGYAYNPAFMGSVQGQSPMIQQHAQFLQGQAHQHKPYPLPPGKNDLEILENLKEIIKSGQHELFRPIPQPQALANIYMGPLRPSSSTVPSHPEQILDIPQQSTSSPRSDPAPAAPAPEDSKPINLPPKLQSKEMWESRKHVASSAEARVNHDVQKAAQPPPKSQITGIPSDLPSILPTPPVSSPSATAPSVSAGAVALFKPPASSSADAAAIQSPATDISVKVPAVASTAQASRTSPMRTDSTGTTLPAKPETSGAPHRRSSTTADRNDRHYSPPRDSQLYDRERKEREERVRLERARLPPRPPPTPDERHYEPPPPASAELRADTTRSNALRPANRATKPSMPPPADRDPLPGLPAAPIRTHSGNKIERSAARDAKVMDPHRPPADPASLVPRATASVTTPAPGPPVLATRFLDRPLTLEERLSQPVIGAPAAEPHRGRQPSLEERLHISPVLEPSARAQAEAERNGRPSSTILSSASVPPKLVNDRSRLPPVSGDRYVPSDDRTRAVERERERYPPLSAGSDSYRPGVTDPYPGERNRAMKRSPSPPRRLTSLDTLPASVLPRERERAIFPASEADTDGYDPKKPEILNIDPMQRYPESRPSYSQYSPPPPASADDRPREYHYAPSSASRDAPPSVSMHPSDDTRYAAEERRDWQYSASGQTREWTSKEREEQEVYLRDRESERRTWEERDRYDAARAPAGSNWDHRSAPVPVSRSLQSPPPAARPLSARLTDHFDDALSMAYAVRDRGYVDEHPVYTRVRQRSPSPLGRRLLDDIRPPMKRIREDDPYTNAGDYYGARDARVRQPSTDDDFYRDRDRHYRESESRDPVAYQPYVARSPPRMQPSYGGSGYAR